MKLFEKNTREIEHLKYCKTEILKKCITSNMEAGISITQIDDELKAIEAYWDGLIEKAQM